ncbi:MAG TPA: tripartite tricarboxylate transporter substrate binding protein [Burkholderiales bacterium]|nr:tripartite tricarboxylate transporter substrate binding protein [Burkholderiales bacterium]
MRNKRPVIFLAVALSVAIMGWSAGDTFAQPYPNRPLRMVIGFPPGGSADVVGRLVGQKLSDVLGQPVVVENRPGASTAIAAERVATAPPDGYTVLLVAASTTITSALRRKTLPYDLERGFTHVSLLAVGPFILVVHPSLPVRSAKEFIVLARSQPGKLNYGSPGVGSVNHVTGELFRLGTGVKIVHVPYKGSSETSVANAAGEIEFSFPSIPAALPFLENNKLRGLAVTSLTRVPAIAAVPTLDETVLPGFNYAGRLGLSVAAAVPRDVVKRLNAAIVKVVNTDEMKAAIAKQGFDAQASTPEEYGALIQGDIAKVTTLIEKTGMKVE